MKRTLNTNDRQQVNVMKEAERMSKNGDIVAVIYSGTFNNYSVRKLRPHAQFPDRKDLFDWNSEDWNETAYAAFKNGKQLDISHSIAPRKIVVNEFPMH